MFRPRYVIEVKQKVDLLQLFAGPVHNALGVCNHEYVLTPSHQVSYKADKQYIEL